jgi:NAD(P)-dependent dehydrogenase (short-subunit alcohol dehydrogenase family)
LSITRERFENCPLYSATKAAVRSLVRTFAVNEIVESKKIRVNTITPGCVKTPLTEAEIAVDGGLGQV